jgi:hypothetical protein
VSPRMTLPSTRALSAEGLAAGRRIWITVAALLLRRSRCQDRQARHLSRSTQLAWAYTSSGGSSTAGTVSPAARDPLQWQGAGA